MTSYRCNVCNAPITERDNRVLTGILDGNRVFYHTQYPASVRDKFTSNGLALLFISGVPPCKDRVEGGLKDRREIGFGEIEALVDAGASLS